MTEIRLVPAADLEHAIQGATAIFRKGVQTSMGVAFAAVYSSALSQSFGAYEDGKLVSFMGLVPATMRIGPARLPMFSIGSVYTLPEYRGRGYAGDLLQAVKAHVLACGGALVYISGARSLYTRNQCHLFGAIERYAIKPTHGEQLRQAGARAGISVRELEPTDWHYVHVLASTRRIAYEQSVRELAELIANEAYASCFNLSHRTLVATKDGRVVAFAVVATPDERGSEQTPFVVEWAGETDALVASFGHAVATYGLEQLEVPVAWHQQKLSKRLSGIPSTAGRNLGTLHITDAKGLFDSLAPYWRSNGSDKLPRIQTLADHRYVLTVSDGHMFELDSESLVSLLFDPVPTLPAALGVRGVKLGLFPVPLPYAGGLNFV